MIGAAEQRGEPIADFLADLSMAVIVELFTLSMVALTVSLAGSHL